MLNVYQNGIIQSRPFYTNMAVFSKYPDVIRKSMDIGQKIEAVRKRKHITRESLAEKLGVTPTTVFRKERGRGGSAREIKLKELSKWAAALDCTVEEIMSIDAVAPEKQDQEIDVLGVYSDHEFGIIGIIQLLFSIIAARNLVTPENLQELFNQQSKFFQAQNRPGAIEVMETLTEALGLKPHESKIEAIRRLLQPFQVG